MNYQDKKNISPNVNLSKSDQNQCENFPEVIPRVMEIPIKWEFVNANNYTKQHKNRSK